MGLVAYAFVLWCVIDVCSKEDIFICKKKRKMKPIFWAINIFERHLSLILPTMVFLIEAMQTIVVSLLHC